MYAKKVVGAFEHNQIILFNTRLLGIIKTANNVKNKNRKNK